MFNVGFMPVEFNHFVSQSPSPLIVHFPASSTPHRLQTTTICPMSMLESFLSKRRYQSDECRFRVAPCVSYLQQCRISLVSMVLLHLRFPNCIDYPFGTKATLRGRGSKTNRDRGSMAGIHSAGLCARCLGFWRCAPVSYVVSRVMGMG